MASATRPLRAGVTAGDQSNFIIVNNATRPVSAFIDVPARTIVTQSVPILSNTGYNQLTVASLQSGDLVVAPTTGALGQNTWILPSAQNLLQTFNGVGITSRINIGVINRGTMEAVFLSPTGLGGVSDPTYSTKTVPPVWSMLASTGTVNPGIAFQRGKSDMIFEISQINGTGTYSSRTPLNATGAYLLY